MAQRRRPAYAPEFRAEAVKRVRASNESIVEIARDLGISATCLRNWMNQTRPQPEVVLTDDERSELTRLRKQVRELQMERDILKKATAFFAKYSE
jgi:transposase